MNREPVNPDDPQMTAYALGELNIAETVEFEARLQESPLAQAELASMREVMSILGEGLRGEWEKSLSGPSLTLLEPVKGDVIIAGDFHGTHRKHAAFAAAAAVALLLVGGSVVVNWKGGAGNPEGPAVADSFREPSTGMPLVGLASPGGVNVPRLFLAEEVENLAALDLAIEDDAAFSRIDASYLDTGHAVPAGFQAGAAPMRELAGERVDSYLPPLNGPSPAHRPTSGMIERRLSKDYFHNSPADRSSTVLVSGYVTMDGPGSGGENRILAGFRPVSISANPVERQGDSLLLLSELNGLQQDLSKMIADLPADSAERADLERVLDKSAKIVSQLKFEYSRR